jgi:hypothetical protein
MTYEGLTHDVERFVYEEDWLLDVHVMPALGKQTAYLEPLTMQENLFNGAARPEALGASDKARIAKTWQQYYEDRGYDL